MQISAATERDAEEILELQKIAFQSEAARYNDWSLMAAIESAFPEALRFELFTGIQSEGNIRLYTRLGYAVSRTQSLSLSVTVVFLEKLRPSAGTPTNRGTDA